MAASFDDPANINAFLRIIHSTPMLQSIPQPTSGADRPHLTVAIPEQPQTMISHAGHAVQLGPRPPTPKSTNVVNTSTGSAAQKLTPTQERLLKKKAEVDQAQVDEEVNTLELAKGYMDKVVEEHRKAMESMFVAISPVAPSVSAGATNLHNGYGASSIAPLDHRTTSEAEPHAYLTKSFGGKDQIQVTADTIVTKSAVVRMGYNAGNTGPNHGESNSVHPTVNNTSPTLAVGASNCTTNTSNGRSSGTASDEEEEDGEHLSNLQSRGSPAERNKYDSCVRTVILTHLPGGADYAFVQSLVHGGSIEVMKLFGGEEANSKVTAAVTFTNGDICDKYYHKYPAGIQVRHQGKRYTVFVEKNNRADMMSGLMQGYLDCGASRVVKVTGADKDWGVMALHKMAEGKNQTRQVETVTDSLHTGIRTILFRFANISDAVKLKGELIRSYDWEGCRIDFAEDPCAIATGVHYN